MAKVKLTERIVAKIVAPDPSGRQVVYWDSDLKGFGVVVSGVTATKTYIAERRLPDGRKRRVTIEAVNVLTLEKARSEAETALHNLRLGKDPKAERSDTTLQKALNDYLLARKTLRDRSRAGYRRFIETYLDDWLNRPLASITADMVEKRHAKIQTDVAARFSSGKRAGAERNDLEIKSTGYATANNTMRALRLLWNFVADRDPTLPSVNPVRRLRKAWFHVGRRQRRLAPQTIAAFYRAASDLPNEITKTYLLVLLFTGMRRGEAASLKWDDIDFSSKVIHLRATTTKSGRKLDLPMSDLVQNLLHDLRELNKPTEFLFPAASKSGHIEEPRLALKAVANKTGFYVSSHDLRRTFLDVAESTEISVYALKALVNHSAGSDVTAGYLGLSAERLRKPTQKIADRFKELGCTNNHLADRFVWKPEDIVIVRQGTGPLEPAVTASADADS